MFAMCGALGIAILLVLVPFTPEFLRLMNTPEEFIADGSTYFRLELFGMVITFFNNVYIAIELARGNSKRILILNTAVIVVKLGLTAWFVYEMCIRDRWKYLSPDLLLLILLLRPLAKERMALRFLLLFPAVSVFLPFKVFRIKIYFYLRPGLTGVLLRLFLRFLCL